MKKLTTMLLLILFVPMIVYAQKTIHAKDVIRQINDGQAVTYQNAVIQGDLDFSLVDDVTKKRRVGSTTTYTYHIHVPITFQNCVFKGSVLGYIHDDWENETHNALFYEDVDFSGCEFEEESAFKYVIFEKDAVFEDAKFNEEALFKYTKFTYPAKFSKSHFYDYANFKYTDFPETAHFDETIFRRNVNFKYAEFEEGVTFEKSVFNRDADFKYTKFHEFVNFDDAEFEHDADFKYTKLNGKSLTLYLLRQKR